MKNQYSFFENIKNVISYIYTKLIFKNARLIRLPVYVRGKKLLHFGKGLTLGYNCRLEMFPINNEGHCLVIGDNCKVGDNVHIAAGEYVEIGNNCLMASKIYISDISHGNYTIPDNKSNPSIAPDMRPLYTKPVIIGDNVWIGENVSILSGVKIGNGSIIGANSVVSKDIKSNTIAVGSPANAIKVFNETNERWERV